MLGATDLRGPDVLEVQLHTLDGEQEAEESVVLLNDIRREHEVERPVGAVVEAQAIPGVLLLVRTLSLLTYEGPVLNDRKVP